LFLFSKEFVEKGEPQENRVDAQYGFHVGEREAAYRGRRGDGKIASIHLTRIEE
jgi:hypothetical protein